MASANQQPKLRIDSAEGAELNDAVCSVIAHELGGIASALDLRAAALQRTMAPNDLAAFRTLAEELRASTRAVRLLRGPDAYGSLSPSRQQTLGDWWRLVAKLSRGVLPKTSFSASFDESRLTPEQSYSLTWIWLSACKELAELARSEAMSVTLRGETSANRIQVKAETALETTSIGKSRWARQVADLAASIDAEAPEWASNAGVLSWTVSMPRGEQAPNL